MNSHPLASIPGICGRILRLPITEIDMALEVNKSSILHGSVTQDGSGLLSCKRFQVIIMSFRCCLAKQSTEHFFLFTVRSMASSERSYGVVAIGVHCK